MVGPRTPPDPGSPRNRGAPPSSLRGGSPGVRISRGGDPATLRAAVVAQAEAAGVRLVRFLYCDNDGIIRGKASGAARLGERLETGIGLTVAMQAFSLLDHLAPVEGMG